MKSVAEERIRLAHTFETVGRKYLIRAALMRTLANEARLGKCDELLPLTPKPEPDTRHGPREVTITNWRQIYGYDNSRNAQELVSVTRHTAELALSALQSSLSVEYYHNVAAACRELREVLQLTPTTAPDTRHAMTFDDIKATAGLLRAKIKEVGDEVLRLRDNAAACGNQLNVDKGEAIANVQLAYRHLEDARMRLGKTIQAIDGGKSVYDSPPRTAS